MRPDVRDHDPAPIKPRDQSLCECGRPIKVYFCNRRAHGYDRYHTLCHRCWRAERDRMRCAVAA